MAGQIRTAHPRPGGPGAEDGTLSIQVCEFVDIDHEQVIGAL
jgi:hypothetical protein